MRTEQMQYTTGSGWMPGGGGSGFQGQRASLVVAFGNRQLLENPDRFLELKSRYPGALILMNSTSGEILGDEVFDNTIVSTAIAFSSTPVRATSISISEAGSSREAGVLLGKRLPGENLKFIFLISDGQLVNGSELVEGINSVTRGGIPVTGGLAGDGALFAKTLVGLDSAPAPGNIVAVGFYGDKIRMGHGSVGGWDIFGHDRVVTRSSSNVLFELDNHNALDIYKLYLGDYARELPGAALLFPLSVTLPDRKEAVVRTILSIDEKNGSMTFAGDIPEGAHAKFMKANFDKLVDGASAAAQHSFSHLHSIRPELVFLISCVGRKLVLGQRIEEEVEVVREVFGDEPVYSGFYSYGEISPFNPGSRCELHNQTMTITALTEE